MTTCITKFRQHISLATSTTNHHVLNKDFKAAFRRYFTLFNKCHHLQGTLCNGKKYLIRNNLCKGKSISNSLLTQKNVYCYHNNGNVQCTLKRTIHGSPTSLSSSKEWLPEDPYSNPLDGLSPYLLGPIIEENDMVFKPSFDDIQAAQPCFDLHKGEQLVPYRGVANPEKLQTFNDVPEVS